MSAFEALLGLVMIAGLVGVVLLALPGLLLIAGAWAEAARQTRASSTSRT